MMEEVQKAKPEEGPLLKDMTFSELALWRGSNPPETVGPELKAAIMEGLHSLKTDPVIDGETAFKELDDLLTSLSNAKATTA